MVRNRIIYVVIALLAKASPFKCQYAFRERLHQKNLSLANLDTTDCCHEECKDDEDDSGEEDSLQREIECQMANLQKNSVQPTNFRRRAKRQDFNFKQTFDKLTSDFRPVRQLTIYKNKIDKEADNFRQAYERAIQNLQKQKENKKTIHEKEKKIANLQRQIEDDIKRIQEKNVGETTENFSGRSCRMCGICQKKKRALTSNPCYSKGPYILDGGRPVIDKPRENTENECSDKGRYPIWHREPDNEPDPDNKAPHCAAIKMKRRDAENGVYKIWLPSSKKYVNVWCDMTHDGGGWTVFQKRQPSENNEGCFYLEWKDYKKGFGFPKKEFWLGLKSIREIVHGVPHELRIDLEDFDNSQKFAKYSEFHIGGEAGRHELTVKGYSGDAGDSMSVHNGRPFSTKDVGDTGCPKSHKGAWWYAFCHYSNLNGMYLRGKHGTLGNGVNWYGFRGWYYSLKRTEMKMRPKNYNSHDDD